MRLKTQQMGSLFRVETAWQSPNRQEVEEFIIHFDFSVDGCFLSVARRLDGHGVGYSAASGHAAQMKIQLEQRAQCELDYGGNPVTERSPACIHGPPKLLSILVGEVISARWKTICWLPIQLQLAGNAGKSFEDYCLLPELPGPYF